MKAREFEAALDRIVAAHSGRSAPSVAAIRKYLSGNGELDIAELASRIKSGSLKAKPARARPAPQPVRAHVVQSYLSRIRSSSPDVARFDELLAQIKSDTRQVRTVELNAIANAYVGGSRSYTSKNAALEAMRRRFIGGQLAEHHRKIAEKATPW